MPNPEAESEIADLMTGVRNHSRESVLSWAQPVDNHVRRDK